MKNDDYHTGPFKFLDSYQKEDSDIFFGRDKEINDLFNALCGVKHLLVYGPSGAGKTSLIECGLRNQFSDADWFALTIRRGADLNASVFKTINQSLEHPFPLDRSFKPVDTDLSFGKAIDALFNEVFQPVYLLFDQFEELLLLGDKEEKEEFFRRLNKLVLYKVPCRVILIMREEFIGHLSEFEHLCPSLFEHRFRLEKINRQKVEDLVVQILEAPKYKNDFKVTKSGELASLILSKLPDEKKEIELTHLQVYLTQLWNRAKEKSNLKKIPVLSKDLVYPKDSLEGVLDKFLKTQLELLERKFEKAAPIELLSAMISERHTKLQLTENDLEHDLSSKGIKISGGVQALLDDLETSRIVRRLKSNDRTHFEISHDILAQVVGQNLTEDIQLRNRAADIYGVYEERAGYLSQEDIDFLRPYNRYLAYSATLEQKIIDSKRQIKENEEQELAQIQSRADREKALRLISDRHLKVTRILAGVSLVIAVIAFVFFQKAEEQTLIAKDAAHKANKASSELEYLNDTLSKQNLQLSIEKDKTQKALISAKKSQREAEEAERKAQHEAIISKSLSILSGVTTLIDEGKKTEALRLAQAAYDTALKAGRKPPLAVQQAFSEAFNLDKPIQKLKIQQSNEATSIALSADSRYILSGSSNRAILWDLNGNPTTFFIGHKYNVSAVAFSPDNQHILTGGDDKTIMLWDLKGNPIRKFFGHKYAITSFSFTADGKYFLSGSKDNTAILWSTKGDIIHKFENQDALIHVDVSSDGGTVVLGSDREVLLWKLGDKIPLKLEKLSSKIQYLKITPHNNIIAADEDLNVFKWSLDGNVIETTTSKYESDFKFVTFSPSETYLAIGGEGGLVTIWNLETNNKDLLVGHYSEISDIRFGKNDKELITGSKDGSIILWDLEGDISDKILKGHYRKVTSVAYSPNGDYILTGSRDKSAILWNSNGEIIRKLNSVHRSTINSVAFSPDSKYIITGGDDELAVLWDLSGKPILKLDKLHSAGIQSVAFSKDGKYILTGSLDKSAIMWDLKGHPIKIFKGEHKHGVQCVAFTPDGKAVLTGGIDGRVILWDIKTGGKLRDYGNENTAIFSIAVSSDGKYVLTAGRNRVPVLYSFGGKIIKRFREHESYIGTVAFSPLNDYIITAAGNKIKLLDFNDNIIGEVEIHNSSIVESAQVAPNGTSLLVGTGENAIIKITPNSVGALAWLQSDSCLLRELTIDELVKYNLQTSLERIDKDSRVSKLLESSSYYLQQGKFESAKAMQERVHALSPTTITSISLFDIYYFLDQDIDYENFTNVLTNNESRLYARYFKVKGDLEKAPDKAENFFHKSKRLFENSLQSFDSTLAPFLFTVILKNLNQEEKFQEVVRELPKEQLIFFVNNYLDNIVRYEKDSARWVEIDYYSKWVRMALDELWRSKENNDIKDNPHHLLAGVSNTYIKLSKIDETIDRLKKSIFYLEMVLKSNKNYYDYAQDRSGISWLNSQYDLLVDELVKYDRFNEAEACRRQFLKFVERVHNSFPNNKEYYVQYILANDDLAETIYDSDSTNTDSEVWARCGKIRVANTEIIEEFLKKFPDYDDSIHNMFSLFGNVAYTMLYNKKFYEAEKMAKRGIELTGGIGWANTSLIRAYLLTDRYNEAVNHYNNIKEVLPGESNETFAQGLLRQLSSMERAGVFEKNHKDVVKFREFLNQSVQ